MLKPFLTTTLLVCGIIYVNAACIGDEFCSPDELNWQGFSPYDAIYDDEDKKRFTLQLPQPEEMNSTEYNMNWVDRGRLDSPLILNTQAKVWRISYVDATRCSKIVLRENLRELILKLRYKENLPPSDRGEELPSYADVFETILSYNYNTFVAGGLVRDAIQNIDGRDVDFAFTIPDQSLLCVVKSRCWGIARYNETNGYFRFPKSGSHSAPLYMEGFNTGKTLHAALHLRDYTVNALYYDYRQKLVVDMSGRGVDDALNCLIRIPVDDFDTWVKGDIDGSFTRLWRFFSLRFKKCGSSTYDSDLHTKRRIVTTIVDLLASNSNFTRTTEYFFFKLLSELYGEQYTQKYNDVKTTVVNDFNAAGFDGESIWGNVISPLVIQRPPVRDIPTDKITFSQSTIALSLSSGEELEDVVAELEANGTYFLPPPIVVEWTDSTGQKFYQTADNRRVVVARQAGLPTIPAIVYSPLDKINSKESTRFSMVIKLDDNTTREIFAENWGEAVRYRSFVQHPFYPATGVLDFPTIRNRSADCPIVDCLILDGPNYYAYGIASLLLEAVVIPLALGFLLRKYITLTQAISTIHEKLGMPNAPTPKAKIPRYRVANAWIQRLLPPPAVMMLYAFILDTNTDDDLSFVGWGLLLVFFGYISYALALRFSDKALENTNWKAWGLVFMQGFFGTLSMAALGGGRPLNLIVSDQYYPLLRWAYVVFLMSSIITLTFLKKQKSSNYGLNLQLADSYHKLNTGMPSALYLLAYGLNRDVTFHSKQVYVFCTQDEATYYSIVYLIVLFIVVLMAMLEVYAAIRYYVSSGREAALRIILGCIASVALHIGFIITLFRRPITCMATDASEFANWFMAVQAVAFVMTVAMRLFPVIKKTDSELPDKSIEMTTGGGN